MYTRRVTVINGWQQTDFIKLNGEIAWQGAVETRFNKQNPVVWTSLVVTQATREYTVCNDSIINCGQMRQKVSIVFVYLAEIDVFDGRFTQKET